MPGSHTRAHPNYCREKRRFSSSAHCFSGLGSSVKATAANTPFDNGVIRPIDGVLTVPENVSSTLPFLGADTFRGFLNETGLLAELDIRASISVLSPDNSAFANTTSYTDAELMELLRQHTRIDFPAYTRLLEDGDILPYPLSGELDWFRARWPHLP
ncbi:hypothetical protein DL766_003393 [Monosporascus sp. MC13-8B]|uniref:FAS1 domain-containing protein n=1 Tax=Monosporascus cannonballus TaxID=155416 RepID=A0ABY0H594_9PEZI|nr:hypothetical protein DL762_006395 [Monosporascus cannonballus]RYO89070.1 hypothetical protein DL763_005780 [Monosporascus cannonballus]RYP33557.1 hypothetical protein DL766_003393 [Monosporascus sp. MC13-8B]